MSAGEVKRVDHRRTEFSALLGSLVDGCRNFDSHQRNVLASAIGVKLYRITCYCSRKRSCLYPLCEPSEFERLYAELVVPNPMYVRARGEDFL